MKERKTLGRLAKAKIKGEKVIIKIDTGAYTGAIDKELAEKIGLEKIIKKKKVKSAHGESIRIMVKVPIKIKGEKLNTRLTLSNRKNLRYPIILGRKFLKGKFVIDPMKRCALQ